MKDVERLELTEEEKHILEDFDEVGTCLSVRVFNAKSSIRYTIMWNQNSVRDLCRILRRYQSQYPGDKEANELAEDLMRVITEVTENAREHL